MIDRDTLQKQFFSEGPKFCRQGAVCLMGAGFALSLLGVALKPDVPLIDHFSFAGLLAIPAGLLAILSLTIARRHVLTVPLVIALCIFAGRFLLVDPEDALAGMTTTPIMVAVSWVVYYGIILGILVMIYFVLDLWKEGAFK